MLKPLWQKKIYKWVIIGLKSSCIKKEGKTENEIDIFHYMDCFINYNILYCKKTDE